MINDFFSSFKDNISQKTKNPFLGTFLLIWIIRNWKFVYSIFTFDRNYSLPKRIETIESYFANYHTITNLVLNILITIAVLILTYFLLALSRFIINFYDKTVIPFVYKLTDKGSIVLKADFYRLREELAKAESRLEVEREAKIKYKNEVEILEQRLAESILKQRDTTSQNKNEKSSDNTDLIDRISFVTDRLKDNKLDRQFRETAVDILNGNTFSNNDKTIKFYLELGLISLLSSTTSYRRYQLSDLGNKVLEYLSSEDYNKFPDKK